MTTYLDVASALVRDAAGSPISQTTTTTTLDGDGSLRLRLPGFPVTSVSAVAADGQAVNDWTLRSGALVRDSGWYGSVQVPYTHGLPAVPADIVDLVCRLVLLALDSYRSGAAVSRSVASERIGDYSVTYADPEAAAMALTASQRLRLAARFGSSVATAVTR
ncbi:hypothetical protein [Streptomyces sp. NPDC007083]|uniref:hypothetical protein n=1 Tax=Streptomyces sp. NPDC007083 TaxID=3156913 RepID=UPI0033FA9F31